MEKNGGTLISWVFHDVTDSTLGFQVKKLQTIQHARVLKGIVILNNDEIRLMCLWEKKRGWFGTFIGMSLRRAIQVLLMSAGW